MANSPKLKIMIGSTVHNGGRGDLVQISATLKAFGYEVWNSELGTVFPHPGKSNLENCVTAVKDCDAFLGLLRGYYGTGRAGERSITHEEFRTAIKYTKPRWFLVNRDVTCARTLLKPYMFTKKGKRTKFKLKPNPVISDLRVFDLYDDATLADVPYDKRTGHWVQPYYDIAEVLTYLNTTFKDVDRIRQICRDMKSMPTTTATTTSTPAPTPKAKLNLKMKLKHKVKKNVKVKKKP